MTDRCYFCLYVLIYFSCFHLSGGKNDGECWESADRVCENIDLAKLAEEMVSWEKCAPYCGLSHAAEWEIKENSRQYSVQKRRILEEWKKRSGEDVTYRNLARIFERVEDQTLADFVLKLAQDQSQTESNNHSIRRGNRVKCLLALHALIALIVLIAAICFAYCISW